MSIAKNSKYLKQQIKQGATSMETKLIKQISIHGLRGFGQKQTIEFACPNQKEGSGVKRINSFASDCRNGQPVIGRSDDDLFVGASTDSDKDGVIANNSVFKPARAVVFDDQIDVTVGTMDDGEGTAFAPFISFGKLQPLVYSTFK